MVRAGGVVTSGPRGAEGRFAAFAEQWGDRYPAISRLWRNGWAEFVPFLEYDVEITRVICTTDAIESVNARYRRAVRARGRFPNAHMSPPDDQVARPPLAEVGRPGSQR